MGIFSKSSGLERPALTPDRTQMKQSLRNPFINKKRAKNGASTGKRKSWFKRLVVIAVIFIIIYSIPSLLLVKDAKTAKAHAQAFSQGLKSQNLDEIKANSTLLQTDIKHIRRDMLPFWPLQIVPFAGAYISDANHVTIAALHGLRAVDIVAEELTPHADILGLKGNVGQAGTAQERVQLLVAAMEKVTPKFDEISKEFSAFQKEVDHINPNRYPEKIGSLKVRENIASLVITADQLGGLLTEAKPLLESLPSILGQNSPKTYLVLFQNDKELRPSGGFLTAYTYITLDKGKITASDSNDIYNLDEAIHKVCERRECPELRPPGLIIRYLPEATGQRKTAWDSRDSNIHPDWVASSLEFTKFYNIAGGKKIDGIIGVDTYVIRDILGVTGPIKVAGYRVEFTKDNVVDELTRYTENVFKGSPDRKALLGDLMSSVMNFVTNAGRDHMQPLLNTGISLLNEKHILISLYDDKAQDAIERFNWAGRLKEYDGDYLHINDANFASGKANLDVTEKIEQKVEFNKEGEVERTITIHYENPGRFSDTLNRGYRDAVRLYVPKGSVLLDSKGMQNKVTTSEEFGKTVFEAFVYTKTKGKTDFMIKYKIPTKFKKGDEYKLMLQKQPGTEGWEHTLELFGKKREFGNKETPNHLTQDTEIKFKI